MNESKGKGSGQSNGAYITPTERKLIDEMDTKSRLSTINEEKSRFRGLRSNRLAPLDGKCLKRRLNSFKTITFTTFNISYFRYEKEPKSI